ncbi:MAG: sodium:solute symporter family transporter [Verrucomicrobiia bacterium]|jgi:SSS family solute:Na+ symporter
METSGQLLSTLDIVIFFGSLLGIMAVGLWVGRKEESASDYFLAGKSSRWWGVAGSIFGSNVSANHIVGMMGVGFSVGFAQSHFEISAIFGLLLLCYGFLPVYRKLNLYTLSEYMSKRYDDRSRVAYAVIMVVVILVIQMVPGFYIGSRSLNILLQDGQTAAVVASVNDAGEVTAVEINQSGGGYVNPASVVFEADQGEGAVAELVVTDGAITAVNITSAGSGYDPTLPPRVSVVGGASFDAQLKPGDVNPKYYIIGIILMALVTGSYTIFGGLKAVIFTDVIQSVLMLVGGLIVAYLTFSQPEIGGWMGMRALDAAAGEAVEGASKMSLYKPANHGQLPWTGVLSGLMVLHFYYWGTNQFIVQRALAARSDKEARLGIIVAGFFKLLIPFMSIGAGIAAFYLFQMRGMNVTQDAAFTELMKLLVAPVGYGLVGIVAAGLIGAILSSLDSMMNSGATIITFDFYKKYIDPDAPEKKLIFLGRIFITVFLVLAAGICIFTMDPNSSDSFFLHIASHQSKLVAGVVVAFALGMFWKRATGAGAITAIIAGVVCSYGLPYVYEATLGKAGYFAETFGPTLNFMHAVFISAIISTVLHVVVSLNTQPDAEKAKYMWTELGGHDPRALGRALKAIGISLGLFVVLALLMTKDVLSPLIAALAAGGWTLAAFLKCAMAAIAEGSEGDESKSLFKEDRFWAGLLCATAVFMLFYFV